MEHRHGTLGAGTFSLSLRHGIAGDGAPDIRVRRATFLRRGFRHRLAFTAQDGLDDVLDPALADRLRPLVADAAAGAPCRRHSPAAEIALPGLTLGGLTVIAGPPRDGGVAVTLRFAYFIGGLQAAFAAHTGFDRPTLGHREALGLRALEDVARPLLDMAGTLASRPGALTGPAAAPGVARALAGVEARTADLAFYAGLLRRYVRDCDPAAQERIAAEPRAPVTGCAEASRPALRARSAGRG
ncbi:MAG: hypothetical protein AAF390_15165 [Pseudomonadota bacterium]